MLSHGTNSYRLGDRGGTVVEIRHGTRRSTVVIDLDGGRWSPRTRAFDPADLYHINKGWYGGTYEPPKTNVDDNGPQSLRSLLTF